MEIEFNTDRITEAQAGSPAARPSVTPAASAPVSFSASNSLLSQLSQLPTVRPEAVARAREAASVPGVSGLLTANPFYNKPPISMFSIRWRIVWPPRPAQMPTPRPLRDAGEPIFVLR